MPARYRVCFELPDGQARAVEVGADEYVLHAAQRAGLELPSVCERGWDLACAARVLDGAPLDQSDSRRYFDEDRAAGFALLCTGRPCSDLRLRTHQSDAMRANRQAHGLPFPRGNWGGG